MSKKPTLLFIHGYRGSNTGLLEITNQFPDYSVHAPNIPPAGPAKFANYDIPTYTAFIANYIKNHHLKKPILIGHSLGSIIAAATAANYPELVNDKLILIAPISKKPAKFFARLVPLTAFLPTRVVDYLTTRYSFAAKDRKLFQKALRITNACGAAYDKKSKKEIKKAGQFSASTSVTEYPFHKNTLIIVGENDRLIPLQHTKNYAAKIKAKLHIVKDSGHILNYEHPKAVAAAIRNFLES